jgi:hypothetical protein
MVQQTSSVQSLSHLPEIQKVYGHLAGFLGLIHLTTFTYTGNTTEKNRHASMSGVRFKSTVLVFRQQRTIHELYCMATVNSNMYQLNL